MKRHTALQFLTDIFNLYWLNILLVEGKMKAGIKIHTTKTKSNSNEFKTDSGEIWTIDTGS